MVVEALTSEALLHREGCYHLPSVRVDRRGKLGGYRDYAARVRFRLLPGVW
jgi:hypothetical protein